MIHARLAGQVLDNEYLGTYIEIEDGGNEYDAFYFNATAEDAKAYIDENPGGTFIVIDRFRNNREEN